MLLNWLLINCLGSFSGAKKFGMFLDQHFIKFVILMLKKIKLWLTNRAFSTSNFPVSGAEALMT
jgi:hypothetical protein